MFNKLRVLLMIGVFGILAMPVFAQGSGGYCDLPITGTTQMGYNTNAGITYFDAHTGGDGLLADLKIALGVGSQPGYAPGDLGHAACAEKIGGGDTYKLKGWAWNSNLGFISFGCEGGWNNAGGGDVYCGSTVPEEMIDYGVTIEAPISGVRKLTGYAWSPTFGWIEFEDQNTGDAYPYGVTVNASGAMSGYAWTQAKVYMNFTGAKVSFTPGPDPDPDPDWCDGKPWLCVTPEPNPVTLEFGVSGADGMKIADGVDGYDINISLMGADGVTPLNLATYDNGTAFLDGITFVWEDTVKKDQTVVGGVTGAVLSKPLNGGSTYFSSAGNGIYTTINKIRSYAPTTGGNLSFTTNTTTPFAVPNENISIMAGPSGLTKNELVLKRVDVTVPLKKDGVNVFAPFPVYPSGIENMQFNFRPAMELGTLFVNSFKDEISGVRQIPENLRLGMVEHGAASAFVSDTLRVKLGYSQTETRAEGGNCSSATFDVQFMKTLAGATNTATDKSFLDRAISLMTGLVDVPVIAVIPGATEGATDLCAAAKAPYLVSTISYKPYLSGPTIAYFSNYLPRISPGNIGNPAVIVHGNIFSQKTANVRGDRVLETQGNIFQKSIRNVVYKRIQPYFTKTTPTLTGNCVVGALNAAGTPTITGCTNIYYDYHKVGDEHVLYFKNANITMELIGGTWAGKWVIVAEGGKMSIKNNIYNVNNTNNNMVLISLLGQNDDNYETGNVYLYPCSSPLRNIQAAIFADGALFSFNGQSDGIDSSGNNEGVPVWSDSAEMLDALGCQLKIEGAISTGLNTIGGADLDSEGKTYLLKGGGRNVATDDFEKRMEAQLYDLNYLRLFKLQVEIRDGKPYDQKCGRALTADLIRDIANGVTVCGTKPGCTPGGAFNQATACDGINPFKPYSENESVYGQDIGPDGDAVPPLDETLRSEGLVNDVVGDPQFDPVYVFYDQSVNDSFVFQDEGSASITY